MNDHLPQVLSDLKDEIRVLRDAVDELTEQLTWLANNLPRDHLPQPLRLRSMPLDPTCPDFHVNNVSEDDVDRLRHDLTSPPTAGTQRHLF